MPWILPAVVGVLIFAGVTLLIDARLRRMHRPDPMERLLPYQPVSVADEAESWLQHRLTAPDAVAEAGEWLTLRQAAARLGLSVKTVRGFIAAEKIPIERLSRRVWIRAADVDVFIGLSRIRPGSYSPVVVPYKGRGGVTQVRYLALLDLVVASLGWTDVQLAEALGDRFRHGHTVAFHRRPETATYLH